MSPFDRSLLDGQTHPLKRRLMAIGRALDPAFDALPPPEAARRMGRIEGVLNRVGIPTMSAEERARIEEAAARIPEAP